MRNSKTMAAFHNTCATVLAASLGQGLIYLCITDRLSLPLAVVAIVTLAAVVAGFGAAARAVREARMGWVR